MARQKILSFLRLNVILLGCNILILAIIAINLLAGIRQNDRYSFQFQGPTREIFVFDQQTGKLFITSPEMTNDYNGEMWTELSPAKKGNSLPLKKVLRDKADFRAQKEFLEEIKRRKEESAK